MRVCQKILPKGMENMEGGGQRTKQGQTLNGANGLSDIEGKVTRVGASERGQRTSFKL